MENKKTIVLNLFAGPGSGKSTFCASIFAQLKWKGIECEMALEYAKDRVWEGSFNVLENQMYVFGKQQHRMFRLKGKVDVIITDSPLLNSVIYDAGNDEDFRKIILNEHHKYENMNFFIERAKPYHPKGRLQSEEGAKELDNQILSMLDSYYIDFDKILGIPDNSTVIVNKILEKLGYTEEELLQKEKDADRGITFICTNVSEEAKKKLEELMEKKELKLQKLVEDFRDDKIM
jgi:adenylate kinase family enzyme